MDAEVISDSSVSVYCWQNEQGSKLIAYWTDSSIPSDSTMGHTISLNLEDVSFDEPVLVNAISGEVYSLPRSLFMAEATKLLVIGMPCYDFPMILAEKAVLSLENMDQFDRL